MIDREVDEKPRPENVMTENIDYRTPEKDQDVIDEKRRVFTSASDNKCNNIGRNGDVRFEGEKEMRPMIDKSRLDIEPQYVDSILIQDDIPDKKLQNQQAQNTAAKTMTEYTKKSVLINSDVKPMNNSAVKNVQRELFSDSKMGTNNKEPTNNVRKSELPPRNDYSNFMSPTSKLIAYRKEGSAEDSNNWRSRSPAKDIRSEIFSRFDLKEKPNTVTISPSRRNKIVEESGVFKIVNEDPNVSKYERTYKQERIVQNEINENVVSESEYSRSVTELNEEEQSQINLQTDMYKKPKQNTRIRIDDEQKIYNEDNCMFCYKVVEDNSEKGQYSPNRQKRECYLNKSREV